MANTKITYTQAKSLLEQGALTKKGFAQLVESGQIKVFRFRSQANKPEVVQQVHAAIVSIIDANAMSLLEAGYRPSIVWNEIMPDEDTSATES